MESRCVFQCIKVKYWSVFVHVIGRFSKDNAMTKVKAP